MRAKPVPRSQGPKFARPADYPTPLGQLIVQYLDDTHISLNQFSAITNVHRPTLVSVIEGEHVPRPEHLRNIAKGLGISLPVALLLAAPDLIDSIERFDEIVEVEGQLRSRLTDFKQLSDAQRDCLNIILEGKQSRVDEAKDEPGTSIAMAREAINSIGTMLYTMLAQQSPDGNKDALRRMSDQIPEILALLESSTAPSMSPTAI